MMLNKTMRLAPPILIVLGGIGILQYHSMQFWAAHTDTHIGWAWSLLIELTSLWLWYQPLVSSRLLGAVASILMLVAPLYLLASTGMQNMDADQGKSLAQQSRIHLLQSNLEQHSKTLGVYLENSRDRSGWAHEINQVQGMIQHDQAELQDALSHATHQSMQGHDIKDLLIVTLLQCAVLVVIQLANIKAILFLAGFYKPKRNNVNEGNRSPIEDFGDDGNDGNESDPLLVLKNICCEHLAKHSLNIVDFSRSCGLPRQQVSTLVNYDRGRRKPSLEAQKVINEALGVSPP